MLQELLRPNWLMECTLAELPLEALQERGIRALVLRGKSVYDLG